jgi:hypothetical protein
VLFHLIIPIISAAQSSLEVEHFNGRFMLILTPEDISPCSIQQVGAEPKLGFQFQEKCFFYPKLNRLELQDALAYVRTWNDHPHDPAGVCVLVQDALGYRAGIHYPNLKPLPYVAGLTSLCHQMWNREQLVADRTWGLRVFKQCFVGSEAVSWLSDYLQISRQEAMDLGQDCLRYGLITHVLGEQDFQDAYFFYRFQQDGEAELRIAPWS